MMDKSVVPLGSGVSIAAGLNTGLGYLLDVNQATYELNSGTDWHLLFIRATRNDPNAGWVFSMESVPAEQVGQIFTKGAAYNPNYSPPYMADGGGYPVAVTKDHDAYKQGETLVKEFPPGDPPQPEELTTRAVQNYPAGQAAIQLKWYERFVVSTVREMGTHVYPLAYHRIVNGNPPQAQVVQVARSDWHFWPVPTVPAWSRWVDLFSLDKTTSAIPPE